MSKIIPEEDLRRMNPQEIVDQIRGGKSVLLSIGLRASFLKSIFLKVIITIVYINIIGSLPKNNHFEARTHMRTRIRVALKRLTPGALNRANADSRFAAAFHDSPAVIGFNHGTRGDVFRVLGIVLAEYWEKPIVLPVSIVTYEAFSGILEKLEIAKIYLCPIISSEQYVRLKNERNCFILKQLKKRLDLHFRILANECVKKDGAVIMPLGLERRPTVFKTALEAKGKDMSTLNLDITKIARYLKKHRRVHYVAFSIDPKTRRSGFNFFRTYIMHYEWYSAKAIENLRTDNSRYMLEYIFLKTIAEKLPFDRWHPKEE